MTNRSGLPANNAKTLNYFKVLEFLRAQEEATAADLSQSTAIPIATVYRLLHALLQEGMVLQTQKTSAPNGRQPTPFSVNPDYAYSVCIMIEKTDISVCLTDLKGKLVAAEMFDFQSNCEKEALLQKIDDTLSRLAGARWDAATAKKKLRSILVTVEADVDIAQGKILQFSGASLFDGFCAVDYFETRYGVPTHLSKLLYVEALACIQSYYRYNFTDYIYLHIGVGFGATVVVGGDIYIGAHGKAGELVRLKTEDGRSWEEAYNTNNLYQRLIRDASNDPTSPLNAILMDSLAASARAEHVHTLMSVLDRALEMRCPGVPELMTEAVRGWANAIGLLNTLFDPEVVVIGGDISGQTPNVFNLIRQTLAQNGDFDGVVLPAIYQTSLRDAVARSALDALYEQVYADTADVLH